jgi:hypothetical protein
VATTVIIAEVQEQVTAMDRLAAKVRASRYLRLLCLLSDPPASRVQLFLSPYLSNNVSFAGESSEWCQFMVL